MASGFLAVRRRTPEVMDQPGLDPVEHGRALRALRRVNLWSGTVGRIAAELRSLARREPGRRWRVLDVASGGGDLAVGLALRARRDGVELEIEGCDVSPTALEHARRNAVEAGAPSVNFFSHDVLSGPFSRQYDVVICTLFLHHLDDADAVTTLRRMAEAAERRVVVDDLCRSRLGYGLAWFGVRLLTRSPVVHVDGPRSVEAAFTPSEAAELARQAGWTDVSIRSHWPERFLMSGSGR